MGENAGFSGGTGRKVGPKLEKLSLFSEGRQAQLLQFCSETIDPPFYTSWSQITFLFI